MKNLFSHPILMLLSISLSCFAQNDSNNGNNKLNGAKNTKDTQIKKRYLIERSITDNSPDYLPEYISQRSEVLLEFSDVNPYLYRVSLTELQRDLINNEDFENGGVQVNTVLGSIPVKELSIDNLLTLEETSSPPKNNSGVIQEMMYQIDTAKLGLKYLEDDISRCLASKQDSLCAQKIARKKEKEVQLMGFQNDLASLKNMDPTTIKQIKLSNEFKVLLYSYLDTIEKLNSMVDLYNDLLILVHSNKSYHDIDSGRNKLFINYLNNYDNRDPQILKDCNKIIQNLTSIYFKLIESYSQFSEENKKKLKETHERLVKFHGTIDKNKYNTLFTELAKIDRSICEENWILRYQTTKINDKADNIQYLIKLNPVSNGYSAIAKPMEITYLLPIRGGWKFDVSAGLMFHYGLVNEKIALVPQSDSTVKIMSEKPEVPLQPSAAVLLNVYWRTDKNYKFALNIGAGTNTQEIYYYFGPGLLLGRSERVGINAGIVLGKVKALSARYALNDIVEIPSGGLDPASLYQEEDPWKAGFYLGITYNLTGKNKEEFSQFSNL